MIQKLLSKIFQKNRFGKSKQSQKSDSASNNLGFSDSKKTNEDELDLYSLNRYQLKNLLDKNVYFRFFQLEDFSYSYNKEIEHLLKKVEKKVEETLLLDLKDQDLKQPIVLICDKGFASRPVAQKLRSRGFINVYFVQGGLKGLLEDEKNINSKI